MANVTKQKLANKDLRLDANALASSLLPAGGGGVKIYL